ncbi:anti-CRISPR protein AcrIIA6 [Streptococcus thermophilus]|nr:anti-CRISPR protein AcrIIA6 [Streptococcus thermophilus]
MIINNDIKNLILEYTGRYFRFENDFYKLPDIKFTDANWQKFKNGETAIEKMGAARVNAMLDCLFEDFELAMIGKAQTNYYIDNSLKMNMAFHTYYDQFKKQQLMKWLETSREDIIGGTGRMYTASGSYIANAYLEVALESSRLGGGEYMLQMRFKDYSRSQEPIPTGRQNRLEWIETHLENIR